MLDAAYQLTAEFDALKDDVQKLSREYDVALHRLYSLITELMGGRETVVDSESIYAPREEWVCEVETVLDAIADCTARVDVAVHNFSDEMVALPPTYVRAISKMGEFLGHPLSVHSITALYPDMLLFKNFSDKLPALESSDKFQDYVKAAKLLNLKNRFDSYYAKFTVWIHDSRHYLDRLRAQYRPSWNGYYAGGDVMSLDALESALFVLKKNVTWNKLHVKENTAIGWFEPYKLFHKFQHCFSREFDCIEWRRGENSFNGKVKWAEGIESVALNLYTNAAKYIPHDEKVYDVTTSFILESDKLKIVIESIGPFVPDAEIEKIFDAGYRASTADIGSRSGSGMGLSSVKHVCDEAGYKVFARSKRRLSVDGTESDWGDFAVTIEIPREDVIV